MRLAIVCLESMTGYCPDCGNTMCICDQAMVDLERQDERVNLWVGPHHIGAWHTLSEAATFLLSLEDDDEEPHA